MWIFLTILVMALTIGFTLAEIVYRRAVKRDSRDEWRHADHRVFVRVMFSILAMVFAIFVYLAPWQTSAILVVILVAVVLSFTDTANFVFRAIGNGYLAVINWIADRVYK